MNQKCISRTLEKSIFCDINKPSSLDEYRLNEKPNEAIQVSSTLWISYENFATRRLPHNKSVECRKKYIQIFKRKINFGILYKAKSSSLVVYGDPNSVNGKKPKI